MHACASPPPLRHACYGRNQIKTPCRGIATVGGSPHQQAYRWGTTAAGEWHEEWEETLLEGGGRAGKGEGCTREGCSEAEEGCKEEEESRAEGGCQACRAATSDWNSGAVGQLKILWHMAEWHVADP